MHQAILLEKVFCFVFYISVHLSRQKFDVKIIVYFKNP